MTREGERGTRTSQQRMPFRFATECDSGPATPPGAPLMSDAIREHSQATLESAPALMASPPALLTVEGPMCFARAVELRDTLLVALASDSGPLALDLSGVTELD